jgi:cysteine desulfurase
VGFLYVRKGIKLPALIEGGGQERNLRAGTENTPAIVGMAYALDKCYRNLGSKNAHLWDLKTYMMARLEAEMPGVAFQGETAPGCSLPTVLNTALPCGDDDCMLLFNLDLMGISASGGSACSSGTLQGSHVLRALGLPEARIKNAVRFSFGVQNTREEVDLVVQKLRQIMQEPVI